MCPAFGVLKSNTRWQIRIAKEKQGLTESLSLNAKTVSTQSTLFESSDHTIFKTYGIYTGAAFPDLFNDG
jgi:hypothetical protein